MAALGPLDSVADVDMVAVAWVRFVPRPSAVSTALSTERCSRPRATVANQDLIVALLEQTVAYAGEKSRAMFDICKRANAYAPSFMCADTRSCSVQRSTNAVETSICHRTPTRPLGPRRPAA